MRLFVTGVDTDVGKTLVSAWICLHTQYAYFKPIQAGSSDTERVRVLSEAKTYAPQYSFKMAASPHIAARAAKEEICIKNIQLPPEKNLVVEGAGGVLVPLSRRHYMVDLMAHLGLPVLVVTHAKLSTFNHTFLTLEALRVRGVRVLGLVVSGVLDHASRETFNNNSYVPILAHLPALNAVHKKALYSFPLSQSLEKVLLCS